MTGVRERLRDWDRRIDAVGDVRALSVLRIVLGPIVLVHFHGTFRLAADGIIYSDRFYAPYADWYPEPGRRLYVAMLIGAAVAAVAMSIGLLTRLATAYSACFVGYHLFLSTTHFAHNRAFVLILLTTIALMPVGRHYSVDALIRRRGPTADADTAAPLWPLWLARFEVVVVYCASATSKLIDPDWWGGLMLQRRAIDQRAQAIDDGAPVWLMDVLADGTFQWWFAKIAVLTEFLIGLGLLHRSTRLLAIWIAICFHVSIQIGADVQVFSWAALAALVIWVTPRVRDRTLLVPAGHLLDRFVRRLDWFGRFEVEHVAGGVALLDRASTGDRARTLRIGADAAATVLSRLPVTFWFAAPWLLVVRWRARSVCQAVDPIVGRSGRNSPDRTASSRPVTGNASETNSAVS